MMTRRIALILPVLLLLVAGAEAAAHSEDRIVALDRYTSDKGRTLGATYAVTLKQINTSIYHCMPWLEVPKEGIGFYKPRDAARDDRYLSLRVYIEQEPSMQFRSEEHTSELQSHLNLVCRLLLEKKKNKHDQSSPRREPSLNGRDQESREQLLALHISDTTGVVCHRDGEARPRHRPYLA